LVAYGSEDIRSSLPDAILNEVATIKAERVAAEHQQQTS